MRYLLVFLFMVLTCTVVSAQEVTEAQKQQLEQIKDPAKRSKLQKKFFRKEVKQKEKEYKRKLKNEIKQALEDSLGTSLPPLDSTLVEQTENKVKSAAEDSLSNYVDIPLVTDSTIVNHAKEMGRNELQEEAGVNLNGLDSARVKSTVKAEGKKRLEEELGTEISDMPMDSLTMESAQKELEKRAENELKNRKEFEELGGMEDSELGNLTEYKDEWEQTQEKLQQMEARQELKQKMASQAREFITQHSDKILQAQSKMSTLKQKYSYVPNSNDLSTAKKRNSLEDKSFWERLSIGGNFNISQTNPVVVDLAPVVAYKINKQSEIGVTGTYRATFGAGKSGIGQEDDETYGYSLFGNHMVFRNFFLQLEGEMIRTTTGTPEQPDRSWKQTLLVGVGRKFKVSKWLEMQTLVMFNVIHDPLNSPYKSPLVFKTGVRLVK
ncbi:hypothetical protein [Fulvivirga ligni]|uniref:hypothetical protein n=1 Tax=Fulvivirga ligni TaxID=2904246 RepID=UPI001F1929F2|nr:hypothetical protein [Fulvivirga ligni]UII21651.1 hypothetical protein LVD16_00160 [Fulvivirga ligni]